MTDEQRDFTYEPIDDEPIDQIDAWYEEHERIRRWYVKTMREMRLKLGRIQKGETVYKP